MSMRGWHTKDDWWFVYASDPTFRCPYSGNPDDADEEVKAIVTEFARRLGMEPTKLLRRLVGTQGRHGERDRTPEGKLTDRCNSCGAKMERVGFLGNVQRPVREDEETTGDKISLRLFGGAVRTEKSIYLPTKKEIREWAYEEYRIHKAAITA